jgi:nucleotide-binding universal stress UspA family protein
MSTLTMPGIDHSARVAAQTDATSPQLLVATDGSDAANGAVCVGALLATQRRLEMEVLTVLASRASLSDAGNADRLIKEQLRNIGARDDRFPIEVRSGPTAQTIARVARDHHARMIIVGDRRRGLLPPAVAGTATRLLPLTDAPMLMVPSWVRTLPARVVMAVDFSMPSIMAARAAIELIGGFTRIDIVHVTPAGSGPTFDWNPWEESYDGGVRGAFDRLLHDLRLVPSQSVATWMLEGDPVSEILRFTERTRCDLVTAGGCNRGFLERMRDRSVTRRLARSTDWMMLVAPRPQAQAWARSHPSRQPWPIFQSPHVPVDSL